MSSADYTKNWVQGIGHAIGSARFAGQTRDVKQEDGRLLRTTYGNNILSGTNLVATIAEYIPKQYVIAKEDYIAKMLNRAYYENGYDEES